MESWLGDVESGLDEVKSWLGEVEIWLGEVESSLEEVESWLGELESKNVWRAGCTPYKLNFSMLFE